MYVKSNDTDYNLDDFVNIDGHSGTVTFRNTSSSVITDYHVISTQNGDSLYRIPYDESEIDVDSTTELRSPSRTKKVDISEYYCDLHGYLDISFDDTN